MGKHDLTIKNMLATAIAVLYVILVYFLVNTLFGRDSGRSTDNLLLSGRSQDNLPEVLTAIVIAVATIVVAILSLRHIYELLRGFVAGGTLVIIAAMLIMLNFEESMERNLTLLLIFIFLCAGTYYAEKTISVAVPLKSGAVRSE